MTNSEFGEVMPQLPRGTNAALIISVRVLRCGKLAWPERSRWIPGIEAEILVDHFTSFCATVMKDQSGTFQTTCFSAVGTTSKSGIRRMNGLLVRSL
jgi:hypothetical protein